MLHNEGFNNIYQWHGMDKIFFLTFIVTEMEKIGKYLRIQISLMA